MDYKIKNELGTLSMTGEVIATIAGYSCVDCYGIVAMGSKRAADGLVELFKKENLTKGVRVTVDASCVSIDLHIIVEYGISIGAVAQTVMESVKYHVETIAGVKVTKVNVFVEGIRV